MFLLYHNTLVFHILWLFSHCLQDSLTNQNPQFLRLRCLLGQHKEDFLAKNVTDIQYISSDSENFAKIR